MPAAPSITFRRLVLGGAFLAATLVAMLPGGPSSGPVIAAEPTSATAATPADAKAAAAAAEAAAEAAQEAAEKAREVAREARDKAREVAAEARDAAREARRSARSDSPRVTIERDGEGGDRKVRIELPGGTEEYESFDQFVDKAPTIAAGVVLIVLVTFMTPIIIIFLVIWYKTRKNRMLNDTLLKLAEKGVMPTPEVLKAMGAGRLGPALDTMSAGMAPAERSRVLRKSAAWSDLRRGVLLGAVGFSICMYSLLHSASANWFGLVLLFVGIGYSVLWYFEDQQVSAARATAGAPTSDRPPFDVPPVDASPDPTRDLRN